MSDFDARKSGERDGERFFFLFFFFFFFFFFFVPLFFCVSFFILFSFFLFFCPFFFGTFDERTQETLERERERDQQKETLFFQVICWGES